MARTAAMVLLAKLGEAAGFNDGKDTDFWIAKQDAVTPLHLAFEAKNREEVEAFHEAALAAGGTDNGAPATVAILAGILRRLRS